MVLPNLINVYIHTERWGLGERDKQLWHSNLITIFYHLLPFVDFMEYGYCGGLQPRQKKYRTNYGCICF